MTITEQFISLIDSVVQATRTYGADIRNESARSKKALEDINSKYALLRTQHKEKADAQIRIYNQNIVSARQRLVSHQDGLNAFENELNSIIPRNRLSSIPPVSNGYSKQEAEALMGKIKEKGFWAFIKRLLSIKNYKSRKIMAAELYGSMDNARQCFAALFASEESNQRQMIAQCKQAYANKDQDILREFNNCIQAESKKKDSNDTALKECAKKIASSPKLEQVKRLLADADKKLGISADGWTSYIPVSTAPHNLLIGRILYPCTLQKPTQEERKLLALLPNYSSAVNGFRIPLTVPMNSSVLLYADCDTGDVRLAAQVFQSIIMRMIRFMPPRTVKAVFFDPINRGQSLGQQLIRLSGDGTSRICEYYLSSQDINAQMNELTNHVNTVCRHLTATNCSNINAYNSMQNNKPLSYTSVVIHDYPNGFDSNSLEQLQVLINNAVQCGISIFVSHKKGDVVEHKALDIQKLMLQKFNRIHIPVLRNGRVDANITLGTSTYSYKPCIVNASTDYVDGVNKHFTYTPPLDNSFMKHIGGGLPNLKSAEKGLDIPFAITPEGSVSELRLGYDDAAYGFITGGVGSGKTSLLHTIITSAVMHYSPAELELWLIDYKVAEFAFYMHNCPPHVRYVVADKATEISYSMIDEIEEEINRRQRAFFSAQVREYPEYIVSAYGRLHPLPRVLVIVDEFHRMSQAAQDEPAYKIKLENIMREGRAHGVDFLFSDQGFTGGLVGLTNEARKQINVRIALRNADISEIKETLGIQAVDATEEVMRAVSDLRGGIAGSAILKCAGGNLGAFSNAIEFKQCRALYASSANRNKIIHSIQQKNASFNREHTFFSGGTRQKMDTGRILQFEAEYPQRKEMGERFYIGTPFGIQPCFYFNLKQNESGENVLLVGSNTEKRMSMIKAILLCAYRYGYTVKILVAKETSLYRENKDFFSSMTKAIVITAFPEICKHIGETANELKRFDSDEEDYEFEMKKELVILIGMDSIYRKMENSPYNQKTAWTVQPATTEVKSTNTTGSLSASFVPYRLIDVPTKPSVLTSEKNAIEALIAKLEERDVKKEVATIPERNSAASTDGIKGYNAIGDLNIILSNGYKIGLHAMIVVDQGTAFKRMRQMIEDGNFKHRLALAMSPEEAQHFLSKTRTMRTLIDSNDQISAVYEYAGSREQCFRPYVFD